MLRIIAIITGLLGFSLCFISDSLPFGTMLSIASIALCLLLTSYTIMLKLHAQSIKYIKLHFIDFAGNHKYIKAYSYAGKFKAIHDLKQYGYTLYAETEYLKEDN